jgi:hypothetical protein
MYFASDQPMPPLRATQLRYHKRSVEATVAPL